LLVHKAITVYCKAVNFLILVEIKINYYLNLAPNSQQMHIQLVKPCE